jgi:hypothetical protein
MSATGRNDVRRADDYYITPAWCVKAIWPKLERFSTCLDPCAGEGRLLVALQDLAPSAMYRGIELDEERATLCAAQNGIGCVHADALAPIANAWRFPNLHTPYDLVIMNPPYSLALGFIQAALASDAAEVAVLLRLNFLASNKRAKFWREHPCDVYVLPKRPSFAVFLSCKGKVSATPMQWEPCIWKASFPVGAELPRECPMCGSPKLIKCTSDATEYAWFHFKSWHHGCAQGRGHWEILHVDP